MGASLLTLAKSIYYLEKCRYFTKSACRQRTCMRDILLIFNEFTVAPL